VGPTNRPMGTEKETILQIIGLLQNYIKSRLDQAEPSQIIFVGIWVPLEIRNDGA